MEEQQRRTRPLDRRPGTGPAYPGAPSSDGTDETDEGGAIQLIWGATMGDFEVSGMTVAEVHDLFADVLGIPPGVTVNLNGEEVTGDTRLATGDALEFVRRAGEKGAARFALTQLYGEVA